VASAPPLPESLRRILADSLATDHPDVGWQPPVRLPSESELRSGITTLEQRVTPGSHDVIRQCFGSLVLMFEPNTKMTHEQSDARAKLWIAALGDLPTDLIVDAAGEAQRTLKWMPKPAELNEIVREKIALRWRELKRARQLLELVARKVETVAAETREQRVINNIATLRSMSKNWRRAGTESISEGRAEATAAGPAPPAPKIEPSPEFAAGLLLARARFWRAQGQYEMAGKLEAEAYALWPQEHRDIAEAS
jgi:hypothetical protein